MTKNTLLFIFIILYFTGIISAIFILTNSREKQANISELSHICKSTHLNKSSKIGVIRIDAPIYYDRKNSSSSFLNASKGVSFWLEQMQYAITNNAIKAVVIRVNSPGGTVGSSQELYHAVKSIKEAGKPVIVSVADICASGSYYATVLADQIFANSGSLIGSIGVIISSIEYSKLLDMIGVKYQGITSGKNKDILTPYKAITEEQKEFLQKLVLNSYEQFLTAVAEGRKKTKEELHPIADGSIFTGEQALNLGLIDQIGTFQDALIYTQKTYNLSKSSIEFISPRISSFNLSEILSATFNKLASSDVNISLESHPFGYSPVLYLYQF